MKTILSFVLLIFTLCQSCKKDVGTQEIWFKPVCADETEVLKYDSIAYTIINYSDIPQYKPDPDFYNQDIYSHSVKLDTKTEFISLPGWHRVVIKRFEMVDKSGKIMYYIPFGKDNVPESVNKLPISFQTQGGTKSITTIRVNRYSE